MSERPLTGKKETGAAAPGDPAVGRPEDLARSPARAREGARQTSDITEKPADSATAGATVASTPPTPEVGGREGPDPVRYGDWEVGGRCVDF